MIRGAQSRPKDRPGDGIKGLSLAGAVVTIGASGHVLASLGLFLLLFLIAGLLQVSGKGRR